MNDQLDEINHEETTALTEPKVLVDEATKGPSRRIVAVNLSFVEEVPCCFWLGLFKKGWMTPRELYRETSIEALFQRAATEGLKENQPVLLSDTTLHPPRFIYLVPVNERNELEDNMKEELVKTLAAWAPGSCGIYFAADLCPPGEAQNLLRQMLAKFILRTTTNQYFLLPGEVGTNTLLNTALNLKFDIKNQDIDVQVFH